MKFKRGDLVYIAISSAPNGVPCIVLRGMDRAEMEGLHRRVPPAVFSDRGESIWYEVYMIGRQDTTYIREGGISTMNPQEAESEV